MQKVLAICVLVVFGIDEVCLSNQLYFRGPALVERNPVLLNSFLPAAMQIISHCTDLLKYDVRPAGFNPTTTTLRPTPPHSPGVYAPRAPPKLASLKATSFEEYFHRLKQSQGTNYFDKYSIPIERDNLQSWDSANFRSNDNINLWAYFKSTDIEKNLELLGQRPTNILKQITRDEDYDFTDEDLNVQRFADNYDDISFRNYVIGNKVLPPTKAYTTLLSLYESLNKETKKLQLNKYGGYGADILKVLVESSTKTAVYQLDTVLNQMLGRRDTSDQNIINKTKSLLGDLSQQDSYLNLALRYIPPLSFSL